MMSKPTVAAWIAAEAASRERELLACVAGLAASLRSTADSLDIIRQGLLVADIGFTPESGTAFLLKVEADHARKLVDEYTFRACKVVPANA